MYRFYFKYFSTFAVMKHTDMHITVYFLDRQVTFLPVDADTTDFDVVLAGDGISRAKIIKILDTRNRAAVLSDDPARTFDRFAADFKAVTAAGGAVKDDAGRTLMIYRRGRYDLPKGHWEQGETIEECALREVGEETGVTNAKIIAPICNTLHAYDVYGEWELKRTHWFRMKADGGADTVPQAEEGIEVAEWLTEAEIDDRLPQSFPTIRDVFAALKKMKS